MVLCIIRYKKKRGNYNTLVDITSNSWCNIMEEKIDKLECELCGSKNLLLIKVEVAGENFFKQQGVCCKCFKNGDIEERVFLKSKKFCESQLQSVKERLKYWEETIESLR